MLTQARDKRRWHGRHGVLVPGLLLLMGCATPQQRRAQTDWGIICEEAPLSLGSSISAKQQRAMTRQQAWNLSVEEVNTRCQTR